MPHTQSQTPHVERAFPRLLDASRGRIDRGLCDGVAYDWTILRTPAGPIELRSYTPDQWASIPACDCPPDAQLVGGQYIVAILM